MCWHRELDIFKIVLHGKRWLRLFEALRSCSRSSRTMSSTRDNGHVPESQTAETICGTQASQQLSQLQRPRQWHRMPFKFTCLLITWNRHTCLCNTRLHAHWIPDSGTGLVLAQNQVVLPFASTRCVAIERLNCHPISMCVHLLFEC